MEAKEILATLKKIEEHLEAMRFAPEEERIILFRKLDPSMLALEAELKRTPKVGAREKLDGLRVDLIALARLDDPDGSTDEEHYAWALEALETLRALLCFDSMSPTAH